MPLRERLPKFANPIFSFPPFYSVFIQMKGATKQRAFDVANEIVEAVAKMNPQPMKLKFEKVGLVKRITKLRGIPFVAFDHGGTRCNCM